MLLKPRLHRALWTAALAGLLGMACTSSGPAAPSDTASDEGGASAAAASGYDSNRQMYEVFPGFGQTSANTLAALQRVSDEKDTSMVAVLVESMRFQSSERARDATVDALETVTGEVREGEPWLEWSNWLLENRDTYPPPSEYLAWKINFMAQIDPRFAQFLRPATLGEIDVNPTELTWGGVIPDGIPDLLNPKLISAQEAQYMELDDRVFGLSINGDQRAYPLRITNAHEMINDIVGGEPIALSW